MNRDNALMLEAMHHHGADRIITSELHKVHTILNQLSTMIHLNRSSETDQLLSKIRDAAEMLMMDSPAEDAEDRSNAQHEPHGYPQGITAIQNLLINQLKKHGFTLTKISHADKERDAYPTVFMQKSQGAMHMGAEIDGMGYINGEPFKEYMMARGYDAKNAGNKPYTPSGARPDPEDPAYDTWQSIAQDHAGEDAESYNAMTHLTQAANHIRHILRDNADDEAQVEHIIRMAQIILGDKKDYTDAEYRKMLDGLIVILNRFIIVPMNG